MTKPGPWRVHRFGTLTSTMDRAALLAREGAPQRSAVVCDEQTAGRGRSGRGWHSPPGQALYTTLILRPRLAPASLPPLSLVIGVAVAEAIEAVAGQPVRLKWPNDVLLGNDPAHQKVAGILLTSSLTGAGIDHVLAGIGVNVSTALADLPPGATSIRAATGAQVTPDALLPRVLERVDVGYAAYLAADGRPDLDAWRSRAAFIGELVSIEENGQRLEGVYRGIDDAGALMLELEDGQTRRITAGDLVRGPRPLVTRGDPRLGDESRLAAAAPRPDQADERRGRGPSRSRVNRGRR